RQTPGASSRPRTPAPGSPPRRPGPSSPRRASTPPGGRSPDPTPRGRRDCRGAPSTHTAMSRTPLRIPPIRRLLLAYGVNQGGDWSGEMALAIGVSAITGSALAVSAIFVAHRALLSPLSPLLVARLERASRPLLGLYLAQAGVFVLLASALARGLGLAA